MDSSTALSKWMNVDVPGTIDFCNAKELRFRAWAEHVGYVRFMNFCMKFIPGLCNDWADLLSRVADKLAAVTEEQMRAFGETPPAILMPMSRMSYHGEREALEHGSVPDGFEINLLAISESDWDEIAGAYQGDQSRVQGITLSDLYMCLAKGGEGVDAVTQQTIRAWEQKLYFYIEPPGVPSGGGVIFTPRSQTRMYALEAGRTDDTRVLVLVVPDGAEVRITTASMDESEEALREHEWLRIDLRRDILLFCHDNVPGHRDFVETLRAVREFMWFPQMLTYVREHWEMCAHCLERRRGAVSVGTGIGTYRRAAVVQGDHKVLTKEEALLAGYVAVLTLVCVATRFTIYIAVKSQTAETTARAVLKWWVPFLGVPELFITDGHPGFASEVMRVFLGLLGVKEHQKKAREAKGGVAIVERKHLPLNQVLQNGFAMGDINCEEDFEMYIAMANVRALQSAKPGRTSPFELWSGQEASTVQRLILRPEEEVQVPTAILESEEGPFLEQLRSRCEDLLAYEMALRDEVARTNVTRRFKEHGQHALSTCFDLRVGDKCSLDGQPYVLVTVEGPPGRPAVAVIRSVSGKERKARYDYLKPLAVGRPVHTRTLKELRVGAFVLFLDSDELSGGMVTVVTGDSAEVHVYDSNTTGRSWLPVWVKEGGVQSKSKKCPRGSEPLVMAITLEQTKLVGEIGGTNFLTDSTIDKAKALGLL
jgi:hypothetical protein